VIGVMLLVAIVSVSGLLGAVVLCYPLGGPHEPGRSQEPARPSDGRRPRAALPALWSVPPRR
jgi:hypothetical protein